MTESEVANIQYEINEVRIKNHTRRPGLGVQ